MRRIVKQHAPTFFSDWLRGSSPDWTPSWGALDSDPVTKQRLKEHLVDEQRRLCCYCESRVEATETSSHIEHLDSRSEHGELDVTYDNLLASCMRQGSCGDAKGAQTLPLTPLDEGCERAFRYFGDGTVAVFGGFGRTDDAAEALRVLKLDHPELVHRRREVLRTIDRLDGADLQLEIDHATHGAPEFVTAIRQHLHAGTGRGRLYA